MGLRQEFQKRIEKKQQEIRDLELKIKEANSYLQALLDSMKLLPKDAINSGGKRSLRPGSALAKAQKAIKKAGKPLHVTDILKALKKPPDKKNRVSLTGSLAGYARRGEVFTRPAPNTFGLIELEQPPAVQSKEGKEEDLEEGTLPESFGQL